VVKSGATLGVGVGVGVRLGLAEGDGDALTIDTFFVFFGSFLNTVSFKAVALPPITIKVVATIIITSRSLDNLNIYNYMIKQIAQLIKMTSNDTS